MKAPAPLSNNDRIGIVSPTRMITKEQLSGALEVFQSWGLEVVLGDNVYAKHGYFAGTDDQRRSDLQNVLDDSSIKAIFCSRGGYGLTRIIDQLDLKKFLKQPKWIVGFSDITALHLQLNKLKIQSLHGMMPVQFDYYGMEESLSTLKNVGFGSFMDYSFNPSPYNQTGSTEAQVIGGNLSLLVESLGTSTEISTDGKILFIEEIDEYLYKIDRMFNQLKRAGKFDNLSGLIVGSFSDIKDTKIPFGMHLEELILNHFSNDHFPICFHIPIGHTENNMAIPFGKRLTLKVETEGVSLRDQ